MYMYNMYTHNLPIKNEIDPRIEVSTAVHACHH